MTIVSVCTLQFSQFSSVQFKLYFNIIHLKTIYTMYINNENNTTQYKHNIGEMAKGQIGLKWPSPCITNLHTYQSNQHKTNLKKNKTKKQK